MLEAGEGAGRVVARDRVSPRGRAEGGDATKPLLRGSAKDALELGAAFLGGRPTPTPVQLGSSGHIWTPADLDHTCLAKAIFLLVYVTQIPCKPGQHLLSASCMPAKIHVSMGQPPHTASS